MSEPWRQTVQMVINLFDFKKNLTEIDDIKQESVSKIFKQNYVFLVSSVTIAQG